MASERNKMRIAGVAFAALATVVPAMASPAPAMEAPAMESPAIMAEEPLLLDSAIAYFKLKGIDLLKYPVLKKAIEVVRNLLASSNPADVEHAKNQGRMIEILGRALERASIQSGTDIEAREKLAEMRGELKVWKELWTKLAQTPPPATQRPTIVRVPVYIPRAMTPNPTPRAEAQPKIENAGFGQTHWSDTFIKAWRDGSNQP
jgi:hypothetical protein